jgi:hypothetical protein
MNWILLKTTDDPSEALVLRSVLEAEGIECKVVKESIGKLYGITMDGLGETRLFVPEEKLEEAKEILDTEKKNV